MIPHSWKAPSAHPQAPMCLASTSQLDPEGRAPYISGPDSQIYQFHGPLSCQIKIFPSVHRRNLTPISEWHNVREEDRSPHLNTRRKYSLHGHHYHVDKEHGNLTDRQQPQRRDVHIVDTPLSSYSHGRNLGNAAFQTTSHAKTSFFNNGISFTLWSSVSSPQPHPPKCILPPAQFQKCILFTQLEKEKSKQNHSASYFKHS